MRQTCIITLKISILRELCNKIEFIFSFDARLKRHDSVHAMVRSEVPPLHFLEFLYELLANGLPLMSDVYYHICSSCMEKGSVWVRTQQPTTVALFVYPYWGEWAGLR